MITALAGVAWSDILSLLPAIVCIYVARRRKYWGEDKTLLYSVLGIVFSFVFYAFAGFLGVSHLDREYVHVITLIVFTGTFTYELFRKRIGNWWIYLLGALFLYLQFGAEGMLFTMLVALSFGLYFLSMFKGIFPEMEIAIWAGRLGTIIWMFEIFVNSTGNMQVDIEVLMIAHRILLTISVGLMSKVLSRSLVETGIQKMAVQSAFKI